MAKKKKKKARDPNKRNAALRRKEQRRAQRDHRTLVELKAAPVVELSGNVFVGDMIETAGNQVVIEMDVIPWRVAGGELRTDSLYLWHEGTPAAAAAFAEQFKTHPIARFRARLSPPERGKPEALLEEFVGVDAADTELNGYWIFDEAYRYFDDPVMGTFRYDRESDCFGAKAEWLGKPIVCNILNGSARPEVLPAIYAAWSNQAAWDEKFRSLAVRELLAVKNRDYRAEGEAEWTAAAFAEKLVLSSITFLSRGEYEGEYRKTGIFGGEMILVRGSMAAGLTTADVTPDWDDVADMVPFPK